MRVLCVCACVRACVRACACVRVYVYALRIVSRDKILCFKNTFIIIIIIQTLMVCFRPKMFPKEHCICPKVML